MFDRSTTRCAALALAALLTPVAASAQDAIPDGVPSPTPAPPGQSAVDVRSGNPCGTTTSPQGLVFTVP
jgi:hypothetical protein